MVTERINEAIAILEKQEVSFECSGPKSIELIKKAEEILGCKLPESYCYFLEKLGNFHIGSFCIFGLLNNEINNVATSGFVWGVLNDRERFKQPKHLITLEDDLGDGAAYALDLSQMNDENECPVVIWPIGGYETTPVLEIVAPDFGTWFLNEVKEQIRWKQEDSNS